MRYERLAAILSDQPIDHGLMLLHFAAPDQIGKDAVLQEALPVDGFFALELRDNTVALLRELGHIGILMAGDFSNDSLTCSQSSDQRPSRPVGRRDRRRWAAEPMPSAAPELREEIGGLNLCADRLGSGLQVAAILFEQLGRFGRLFGDHPICLALQIILPHLILHFGQFRGMRRAEYR